MLWTALQGIEDRWTKKGRRFSLQAIIAIALLAMLSGANQLMVIFRLDGGCRRRLCTRSISTGSGARHRFMRHFVFQSIAADVLTKALGVFGKCAGKFEKPPDLVFCG